MQYKISVELSDNRGWVTVGVEESRDQAIMRAQEIAQSGAWVHMPHNNAEVFYPAHRVQAVSVEPNEVR